MLPIRAFFAIDLPNETKNTLHEALLQLHASSAIRWSQAQNLHVTLQFLESLNPDDIPSLIKNVQHQLIGFHSFQLELTQLELFPNDKNPRILSLKTEPATLLSELSARVGKGITETGYTIEQRKFRGHLTLGRGNKPDLCSLQNLTMSTVLPCFSWINEIILFESKPTQKGSNYIPLDRLRLVPHLS